MAHGSQDWTRKTEIVISEAQPKDEQAACWNDDDTYPHTTAIRFGILESKTTLFFINILKGMAKMPKLTGIKV